LPALLGARQHVVVEAGRSDEAGRTVPLVHDIEIHSEHQHEHVGGELELPAVVGASVRGVVQVALGSVGREEAAPVVQSAAKGAVREADVEHGGRN
jgi:hypothetical protein